MQQSRKAQKASVYPALWNYLTLSTLWGPPQPRPTSGAGLSENRHSGNTSIVAVHLAYRLSAQRLGIPALAKRCLRHWGQQGGHPHACGFPLHHAPLNRIHTAFLIVVKYSFWSRWFQLLRRKHARHSLVFQYKTIIIFHPICKQNRFKYIFEKLNPVCKNGH